MRNPRLWEQVETRERPVSDAPAPQWQNLFLAPPWEGHEQDAPEEAPRRLERATGQRRPRRGRRSKQRAA
ncbi:hypothetical protein ACVV2G_17260 [Streptomyces ziwulingensis]